MHISGQNANLKRYMHPYVRSQGGKGLGEGWTGSLGLTNANYYIEYIYISYTI